MPSQSSSHNQNSQRVNQYPEDQNQSVNATVATAVDSKNIHQTNLDNHAPQNKDLNDLSKIQSNSDRESKITSSELTSKDYSQSEFKPQEENHEESITSDGNFSESDRRQIHYNTRQGRSQKPQISKVFKPYRGFDGTQVSEQQKDQQITQKQDDRNEENKHFFSSDHGQVFKVIVSKVNKEEDDLLTNSVRKNNDIYGIQKNQKDDSLKKEQQKALTKNIEDQLTSKGGNNQPNIQDQREYDLGEEPKGSQVERLDQQTHQTFNQISRVEADSQISSKFDDKMRVIKENVFGDDQRQEQSQNSHEKQQQYVPDSNQTRLTEYFSYSRGVGAVKVQIPLKTSNVEPSQLEKKQASEQRPERQLLGDSEALVNQEKCSDEKKSRKPTKKTTLKKKKARTKSKSKPKKVEQFHFGKGPILLTKNKNVNNTANRKKPQNSERKMQSNKKVDLEEIKPTQDPKGSVMHYKIVQNRSSKKKQLVQVRRSARVFSKSKFEQQKSQGSSEEKGYNKTTDQRVNQRNKSNGNNKGLSQRKPWGANAPKSKNKSQVSRNQTPLKTQRGALSKQSKAGYAVSRSNSQELVEVDWIRKHFDQIEINNAFMYEDFKAMNNNDVQITKLILEMEEKLNQHQKQQTKREPSGNQGQVQRERITAWPVQRPIDQPQQNEALNEEEPDLMQEPETSHLSTDLVGLGKPTMQDAEIQTEFTERRMDRNQLKSEQASQKQEAQEKRQAYESALEKFKVPNEFPLTVERVVDPDINNRGIYALVKLGRLSEFELGTPYAITPVSDTRFAKKKHVVEVLKECEKLVPKEYAFNIAFVPLNSALRDLIRRAKETKLSQSSN